MSHPSLPHDWLPFARIAPSPHCDARPQGMAVELLVIHNISLPPAQFNGEAVEQFFLGTLNPKAHPYFQSIAALHVSAHFFIRRNGELIQFVPCSARAWHAGVSSWRGRGRCNDFSLGIELEGTDERPYTQKQYQKLRRVIRTLTQHWPIKEITGHCHIAPDRKTDPGPAFNWQAVANLGLMCEGAEGAMKPEASQKPYRSPK